MRRSALLPLLLASTSLGCPSAPPLTSLEAPPITVAPATTTTARAQPPPPPRVPEDPVLSPAAIFVAEPHKAFPRRAVLVGAPELRLSKTSEDLATERSDEKEPSSHEETVLESGPDKLRLLLEGAGVRLAAYVEARAALELPVRDVVLRVEGVTGGGQVLLRPGAPIEAAPSSASERRVRLVTPTLEASGWLPADALARVFTPADAAEAPATHLIEQKVEVKASPGGPTLAIVRGSQDDEQEVREVGELRDGFRKIVIEAPRYRVEGWVAEGSVKPIAGALSGFGTGFGGGWGGTSSLAMPAGTGLFGSDDGDQVGVLLRDERVNMHMLDKSREKGSVYVPPWGFVDVWLDSADVRLARDAERAKTKLRARVTLSSSKASPGYADPKPQFELARWEVADCIAAAEQRGKPRSGELKVVVTLSGYKPEKSVVSGPAVGKDKALRECLEKELAPRGRSQAGGSAPSGGTLEATFKIAPPG